MPAESSKILRTRLFFGTNIWSSKINEIQMADNTTKISFCE